MTSIGVAMVSLMLAVVPAAAAADAVSITTLSNRADLISGGDALVAIGLAKGVSPVGLRVDLGGRDITGAFAPRASEGGRIEGLVKGLKLGGNVLSARLPSGQGASLTITNHPIGGPVFSGPQIKPWYCQPRAADSQCDRPTTFTWYYRATDYESCLLQAQTTAPCFLPYDPANPPSSVPTTTTDQGKTVPYIVRVETGDMDRSKYQIAVLADPHGTFDRWSGPPAWNHKVLVSHGAGCSQGHAEGPAPTVLDDLALSKGFASVSTNLSDNDYDCNLVVQAESEMMLKEHLIETYGDVRYVIGAGCSGGSIAQLWMANAYPGLYNGLIVACTMPDAPINDLLDCKELLNYWESPASWATGVAWTEPQEAAAAGLASTSVCHAWVEVYHYPDVFNPSTGVGCGIPTADQSMLYNAQTNPRGLRCSFQDYMVNIFGLRPPSRWGPVEKAIGRGFANRPYDNVGVLYGLRALQAGQISPAQFVDLNAKIGGVDIDYNVQPKRVNADPLAIVRAYRSGVMDEANNLNQVAIIDIPGWIPADRYEIHDNQKSWGLDERLQAFTGSDGNHAMWYGPSESAPLRSGADVMGDSQAFSVMDEWMSAVERDHRHLSQPLKIIDDRPADARNVCDLPDTATCNKAFGPAGNARWAAGEQNLANDVIKCQLKPLDRSDFYPTLFTDDEWAQLEKAFPAGVCDWTKHGVDQQGAVPWQTYQGGPGGQPLGPAPVSHAL